MRKSKRHDLLFSCIESIVIFKIKTEIHLGLSVPCIDESLINGKSYFAVAAFLSKAVKILIFGRSAVLDDLYRIRCLGSASRRLERCFIHRLYLSMHKLPKTTPTEGCNRRRYR